MVALRRATVGLIQHVAERTQENNNLILTDCDGLVRRGRPAPPPSACPMNLRSGGYCLRKRQLMAAGF